MTLIPYITFVNSKKMIKKILLLAICCFPYLYIQAQEKSSKDSVVQLYGVVMTADSLRGLPAVSIMVKGQNRGTISNEEGVFSIVVLKGDEVEFTSVGFKPKMVKVPVDLKGDQFSMIQLMVNDTVYLPATIIKQRPTREQFERDFVNTVVPYDELEIARANNDMATRRLMMTTLTPDGKEATSMYLRQQSRKLYYSGQIAPMNIFNPFAWSEFIKSWKRGDYKKKK
jgi:CarboxypepD_reg-like domain